MNTPPTISSAPLPMAPIKSSRKQLNKLDIKPKKLLYSDQDGEIVSGDVKILSEVRRQENLQLEEKTEKKDSMEEKPPAKHVEQNELENEASPSQIQHPYNLRRRNTKPVYYYTKQETKTKIIQNKFEDNKENVELEIASTSAPNRCSFLSNPDENLSKWEKLEWLQERRDVGVWVECCNKNCKKWRFVEEFHDPVEVPEFWICSMNPIKYLIHGEFSSCKDPVDPDFERYKIDLIENEYNAGSLVWARVHGFPWYPGMVDDCPDTLRYYELKGSSQIPVRYHVTFFGEETQHSWLTTRCIKPLKKNENAPPVKRFKTIYCGINYAELIEKSLQEVKLAIPLSIKERLEKFSFRTRYLCNPFTTAPKRKSKTSKKCYIGIRKLPRKKKVKSKISASPPAKQECNLKNEDIIVQNLDLSPKKGTLPEPTLPSSSETILTPFPIGLEPPLFSPTKSDSIDFVGENPETTSTPCFTGLKQPLSTTAKPVPTSNIFVEENRPSQESYFSDLAGCSRDKSSDSGLSPPCDREENLAIIEHFVDNILARKYQKKTGRDLIEDARLYEERLKKQEKENRLFYHLAYDNKSGISSQASIISRESQQGTPPRTTLVPRVVLKKIDNFPELLQREIAKGLPKN